jgi:hypothetical protein
MIEIIMFLHFTFLGFTGQADVPKQARQPESLCELLTGAAQHDGSIVTVEGVYLRLPHGSVLTTPGCSLYPNAYTNLRLAPGFHQKKDRTMKTLWSLTEKMKPAKVVLMGTFHVAKSGQCFGQDCEPYEIEVTQYLSAEPYSEQIPNKPPQ